MQSCGYAESAAMRAIIVFCLTLMSATIHAAPALSQQCAGTYLVSGAGRCSNGIPNLVIPLTNCSFRADQSLVTSVVPYVRDPHDHINVTITEKYHDRIHLSVAVGGINPGQVCAETGFGWMVMGTDRPSPSTGPVGSPGESPGTSKQRVWHGWGNGPPCSKLVTDNGFPYVKMGPQEIHAEMTADVPDGAGILQQVQQCGGTAAGACAIAAWMSSGAACLPAFKTSFMACVQAMGANIIENSINFRTWSECQY